MDLASMYPIYLPQELIDNILDHLHDDPATLRSCSIVCRAWLPTSRLHLFCKISLGAASHGLAICPVQDRCRRLYRLLLRAPEIVPYIRELELCEGAPNYHLPDAFSTAWVTTEWSLISLFSMLTHLRRLDFAASAPLYWKNLPPSLQSAFCALLALPTLTYVRLHSWVFPNVSSLASTLSRCHNLTGLALSSTSVSEDQESDLVEQSEQVDDTSAQMTSSSRLEVLTLDHVHFGYMESWLRSAMDVTSLRELRVSHFHDATMIERLLLTIGSSLEHLHLKPGSWDVRSFDLGFNSGLRSIRLTLEEPETAMTWVTTLISSIMACNVLELIGLDFFVDLKKLDGWEELDSLLVRPELASLRQVEIGLFAQPSHVEFGKVKEELSGLGSRGVLRLYQLGIKSQRSSRQLTPRISRYETGSFGL